MKKLSLFLAAMLLFSAQAKAQLWGAFINLEGRIDSSVEGELKPHAFIPVYEGTNNIMFIDLRGYMKNPLQGGINLGFGYRHMVSENVILGANVVYDGEFTENANYFNQLGLGLELLTPRTELRVNFYLPEETAKEDESTQILYGQITDGNFEVVYKEGDAETAMPGMDAFFTYNQPLANDFFLSATVGGYMYFGGPFYENVYGFAAAVGLEKDIEINGNMDMTLSAGGGYNWDSANGHNGFGSLGVKLSFGGSGSKKGSERQLYSGIERESDIKTNTRVVDDEANVYDAETNINGQTYGGLTEVDANDDVEGTIEDLGNNTLVHLRGEAGVIHISSAIDLNEGQTIVGDGYAYEVVGPNGQSVFIIVDSERASIVQDANDQAAINLADNSAIINMDLSGDGPVVVYGDNIDDALISGITFNLDDYQTALYLTGGKDVTIKDIQINADSDAVAAEGINVSFSNGTTIKNVSMTGVTTGVALTNSNSTLIEDINVVLTTDNSFIATGVALTNNLNTFIDDVNVYGNGSSIGIQADNNVDLDIVNSWFGNHTTGVVVTNGDDTYIGSTVAENNQTGVLLFDNSETVLNGVQAYGNTIGINIYGGDSVNLNDIYSSSNTGNGIQIVNVNNVYMNDIDASNNGGMGISVEGGLNFIGNNMVANNNGSTGISFYQVGTIEGNGITASGNLGDGVYVGQADALNLDGVIAENNFDNGIYIIDVSSVLVENITANNNLESGLAISNSMLTTVRNVLATGNTHGVFITNNTGLVEIDGVTAEQNVTAGILINEVFDVSITNSNSSNNVGDGIQIFFTDYVYMNGVVASYNDNIGIYFYDVTMADTENVTVEGNGTDFIDAP